MPTLLLSSRTLPAAELLSRAARNKKWRVVDWERDRNAEADRPITYYGGIDTADEIARKYGIALLEPDVDLLAKMPVSMLLREVGFDEYHRLQPFPQPVFMKPAASASMQASIATSVKLASKCPQSPKRRCCCRSRWTGTRNGGAFSTRRLAAVSPYFRFGHVVWRPFQKGGEWETPEAISTLIDRLIDEAGLSLPPAVVVDVGYIAKRGWAIVEFNPIWCSGLLAADPDKVLPALQRASCELTSLSEEDRRWVHAVDHGLRTHP